MNTTYIKQRLLTALAFALVFSACEPSKKCPKKPDLSGIEVNLEVERLEDQWKNASTPQEMDLFLKANPAVAETFFMRGSYPSDSIFTLKVLELAQNPHIDTLLQETKAKFQNLEKLKEGLEYTFKNIKYHFPDFKAPKIQTTVSGLANDMYFSDSLIVIGLDCYLGPKAKYRPINYPAYVLRRYDEAHLLPSIALLLSQKYNSHNPADKSMLSDMIFYGKSYHFAKQVLPCTPDSLIIGYTSNETEQANTHQPVIWASLLQNEMIYEKAHLEKSKFMDERPNVPEIGPKCPGRIGRFIGWKIIDEYQQKENISLQELMKLDRAPLVLKKSKYKPQ